LTARVSPCRAEVLRTEHGFGGDRRRAGEAEHQRVGATQLAPEPRAELLAAKHRPENGRGNGQPTRERTPGARWSRSNRQGRQRFMRTLTVVSRTLAVTRSGRRTPSRLPAAMESGPAPVLKSMRGPNFPAPVL